MHAILPRCHTVDVVLKLAATLVWRKNEFDTFGNAIKPLCPSGVNTSLAHTSDQITETNASDVQRQGCRHKYRLGPEQDGGKTVCNASMLKGANRLVADMLKDPQWCQGGTSY